MAKNKAIIKADFYCVECGCENSIKQIRTFEYKHNFGCICSCIKKERHTGIRNSWKSVKQTGIKK